MENGAQNTAVQSPPGPSAIPINSGNSCPSCGAKLNSDSYFCPNCGKKIKEPPPSTKLGRQIAIYLFALAAPPFGIIPAIKYLRQKDEKSKIIGYFIIVLTIISFCIGIWFTLSFIDQLNKSVNLQQLNDLQNAGI